MRPMLGDLALQQVQKIEIDGDQVLVQHGVPALEGDFFQRLGRRATQVTLSGVLTGAEVGESLADLRAKFRAAEPVSFVADISTAVRVDEVLIEAMGVRELAGKPARFEYAFTLREYIPAPAVTRERPPPPIIPPQPKPTEATLEVTVVVVGQDDFDHELTTVIVDGRKQDGSPENRELRQRNNNVWTETRFPPGTYTVTATTRTTPPMTGSASATVPAGQTTPVTITLRPGQQVAEQFLVSFWFDKAFIEPCQRAVLRQVAAFAAQPANADKKLVIVGHTDESGSDDYNQSLSERRSRSVHAYLTYGRDPVASVEEWDQLRRRRTPGQLPSINDTWSVREYQYMLQELGHYNGRIDSDHGPLTTTAVRDFQTAKGLTPTGNVDDATWPVLIDAYMAQDNLNVPADKFLPNAKDSCNSGQVEWLGCGEKMPVTSTPRGQCGDPAWRPNRRTDMLFVTATEFPCDIPEPVTWRLPAPPPGGPPTPPWCLGPGDPDKRCCFITFDANAQDKWLVRPAEPGDLVVQGRIEFEDGTPLANTQYVLIAPDGEFMDGEQVCSGSRPKGTPFKGRTDANGAFSYEKRKGIGTYTIEIDADVVARVKGAPISEAQGPVVCRRLASDGERIDVVVVSRAIANVIPSITADSQVVVVRKPHTSPVRRVVTLSVNTAFTGSGTFTRSSDAIRFFDAAAGGTEITFDGTDNVFTDAQLLAGVTLFAEGDHASTAVDDVELRLALTINGQPGFADTLKMTAVELTLDVALSRPAAGAAPPVMSAADKVNVGRFLQAQNPLNQAERAMLIVRPVQPAGFVGEVEVRPINGRLRLFNIEQPAAGQAPLPTPHVIATSAIPAGGAELWLEGVSASTRGRDTGVQLGLRNVDPDGDSLLATVVQLEMIAAPTVGDPALNFVRVGLWDNAFSATTGLLRNAQAAANNFIDLDTRRFHFRIRDASAAGEVHIDWRSEFDSGATDDTPPAGQSEELTLTETGANSGVFISRAVMLVTDNTDRDEPANSGLPAGHNDSQGLPDSGNRNRGQSNHRKRKITVDNTHQLDNRALGLYSRFAGINPFRVSLPLFERAPEERRRIRVHFINVRDRVGGTGVLTNARRDAVTAVFRSIYAVCGIFIEVDVTEIDPPASATGWPGRFPGDPLAVDPAVEGFQLPGANLVASTSQTDLINAVRALPTFAANDLYVIYVNRIFDSPLTSPLTANTLGQAFPDAWVTATSPARGFTFVGVRGATSETDVHEVAHVTTDLRNLAGGHFYLGPPPAPNFAIGNIDAKNLMFPIALSGLGVRNPKRLWDTAFTNNNFAPPMVIPRQIDAIRRSRFIRPF